MYFDLESKSDVHFLQPEQKTLHNTEKTNSPDYQGFPVEADQNGYRILILRA